MGKTLLQLLETYPFDPTLNPNKETSGIIKPNPGNAFDINVKQTADWVKATPQIYGADIESWGPYEKKRNFDFPFKPITFNPYKIHYNDNMFDLTNRNFSGIIIKELFKI